MQVVPLTPTPMSQVLEVDEAHGIVYRTMVPADVDTAMSALAHAFYEGEPTTKAAGCTLKDWQAFCELFVPRMAAEGHAVLAAVTNSGDVAGVFLNEDYSSPDPAGLGAFTESADGDWAPTLKCIEELEESFNGMFGVPEGEERPRGKWFHLWMIGVAPAGRGKGVGKKLAQHSVALAKERGFEVAFAECTGAVSTHIMKEHTGAIVSKFIDYGTWAGCDTANVLRELPAQGHSGMSLTVNKLK